MQWKLTACVLQCIDILFVSAIKFMKICYFSREKEERLLIILQFSRPKKLDQVDTHMILV
jgi:hypothetical protein